VQPAAHCLTGLVDRCRDRDRPVGAAWFDFDQSYAKVRAVIGLEPGSQHKRLDGSLDRMRVAST